MSLRTIGTFSFVFMIFFCCGIAGLSHATTFRIATWNAATVDDDPETTADEYQSFLYVVNRVNADIFCFQEVLGDDDLIAFGNAKTALSQQFGLIYPWSASSEVSGSFNGFDDRSACLSKYEILSTHSWSSVEISGDPTANDITRDIFEVHLSLSGKRLGVFIVHPKASSTTTDRFRRAVEFLRLRQVIDRFRLLYPGSPFVAVGDFNEDCVDGAPFGDVFTSLPGSLPASYHLGSDISLPIIYDPFDDMLSSGLPYRNISHEDTPSFMETYVYIEALTYKRLDYIFYQQTGLLPLEGIVYDACDDDGIDAPPAGNFLNLRGQPLNLTCNQSTQTSISTTASDHFPVVLEFSTEVPQPVPLLTGLAPTLLFLLFSCVLGISARSRRLRIC